MGLGSFGSRKPVEILFLIFKVKLFSGGGIERLKCFRAAIGFWVNSCSDFSILMQFISARELW